MRGLKVSEMKDPCRWVKWDEKHKGESNEMKNVNVGQMKLEVWVKRNEVMSQMKWSE